MKYISSSLTSGGVARLRGAREGWDLRDLLGRDRGASATGGVPPLGWGKRTGNPTFFLKKMEKSGDVEMKREFPKFGDVKWCLKNSFQKCREEWPETFWKSFPLTGSSIVELKFGNSHKCHTCPIPRFPKTNVSVSVQLWMVLDYPKSRIAHWRRPKIRHYTCLEIYAKNI